MWRWFLGISATPALVVGVAYIYLPESARFLSVVGKHAEAAKVCLWPSHLRQGCKRVIQGQPGNPFCLK